MQAQHKRLLAGRFMTKLLATLALAVGFTTAAAAATTTKTWVKFCEGQKYVASASAGITQYDQNQAAFVFRVDMASDSLTGATILRYGASNSNYVYVKTTDGGKYRLEIWRNGQSVNLTQDSAVDVTEGTHVFSLKVRRGDKTTNQLLSAILYMDGVEIAKIVHGQDGRASDLKFSGNPMSQTEIGQSGKNNLITLYRIDAVESSVTSYAADTTDMQTYAADAAILFPALEKHTATVSSATNWSSINWSPAIDDPLVAELELTVENNATIAIDSACAYDKIKVIGDVTFVASDSIYEDGCFQKTLLGGAITATGTISFGGLKDGYKGSYVRTSTAITLRAQNREVISINIGGGKNTADTSEAANLVSGSDYYGLYPVPGSSWNNISGRWQSQKTVTLSSAKSFDGATTTERASIKLSGSSKNTWQCDSIANPFLRGYLDDGGDGVNVTVTGIPYSKYDVIVYVTSDSANYRLRPLRVNGTWYTYDANGDLTTTTDESGAVWGAGAVSTPEIGKNAILLTDLTEQNLEIVGKRPNSAGGRATVCAVQLISRGEVRSMSFSANVTASTAWNNGNGAGLADKSGTWENSALNTITLTNTADNATLTLDGEITAASLKIVSAAGKTLRLAKANGATLDITGYNLTEAAGDVIFDFDPDFTKVDAGSNLINIGYAVSGAPQDGFHYIGTGNAFTVGSVTGGRIHLDGTGTLAGDLDVFGGATVTIGGTYTTAAEAKSMLGATEGTLTIAEGADVTVTHVKVQNNSANTTARLNVNGRVTVTSTSGQDVYSVRESSGILFGHWTGSSVVTVGQNGALIGENCWIQMTYTSTTALTIDGGLVKVKGINLGSRSSTLTLTGNGTLEIDSGLVSQNNCSYTFDGGTLKAAGAFSWTPDTTTVGANGMTVDANGNAMTFTGAFAGEGAVTFANSSATAVVYTLGGARPKLAGVSGSTLLLTATSEELIAGTIAFDLADENVSITQQQLQVKDSASHDITISSVAKSGTTLAVNLQTIQPITPESGITSVSAALGEFTTGTLVIRGSGDQAATAVFDCEVPAGVTVRISGKVNLSVGGAVTALPTALTIDSGAEITTSVAFNGAFTLPANTTLTLVGTETEGETTTFANAYTINGTLKTQGYVTMSAANTVNAAPATLDVETGTLALTTGDRTLKGTVYVRAGATLAPKTTDGFNYSGTQAMHVYGTLAMGSTRWTTGGNNTIYLYGGASVIGSNNAGSIDMNAGGAGHLVALVNTATGAKEIDFAADLRSVNNADGTIEVQDGAVLKMSGRLIGTQKITKSGAGTLILDTPANSEGGYIWSTAGVVGGEGFVYNLTLDNGLTLQPTVGGLTANNFYVMRVIDSIETNTVEEVEVVTTNWLQNLTLDCSKIDQSRLAGDSLVVVTAKDNFAAGTVTATKKSSRFSEVAVDATAKTIALGLQAPTKFLHYDFNGAEASVTASKAADSAYQISSWGDKNGSGPFIVNKGRNGKSAHVFYKSDSDRFVPYWDDNTANRSPAFAGAITVTTVARLDCAGDPDRATMAVPVWGLGATTGTNEGLGLVAIDGSTVAVVSWKGSASKELARVTGIQDLTTKFHFFAVVADMNGTKLYVDKMPVAEGGLAPMTFGKQGQLGSLHGGLVTEYPRVNASDDGFFLDDWAIYDAALTPAEIKALAQKLSPVPTLLIIK